ncbi:hypothetical protein BKA65DRAFT_471240 [Rhexocercosporidium sp. MPI-PUGE-AT-0058]|nr:hypothetical protein BKA65DRAFT_471240 [Rhexocercosporidium sp. MPI-PUGE-AT-0058]
MAPTRTAKKRKSRARPYTPPPDLKHTSGDGHIRTPARTAIIALKLAEQLTGNPISCDIVKQISSVTERSQSRVLRSYEVRTRHNLPDSGPDPRGRKRSLTRNETAAIADYLDDDSVLLIDRGAP